MMAARLQPNLAITPVDPAVRPANRGIRAMTGTAIRSLNRVMARTDWPWGESISPRSARILASTAVALLAAMKPTITASPGRKPRAMKIAVTIPAVRPT